MSEETEWVMISLDELVARRQGLPVQMPVPKSEFEGLADEGLNIDKAREWVRGFLETSEAGKDGHWRKRNSNLMSSWDAFMDKAPMWERAQAAFADNDYEKAIKTLKRITIMDDNDHAAKLNLASAYANVGDHQKAAKAFKQVRDTFKGDADFHVSLGHLHIAMKKPSEAIDEFVAALEVQADCQPALEGLIQLGILVSVYEDPKDAASLTYVRHDSVLEYLNGLWTETEHDADFFLEQLAYHEREQRHEVAFRAAELAIEKGAEGKAFESAELGRISAIRAMGRHDEAVEQARACATKLAESAGAQVELARCLRAKNLGEEARAAIERALSLDPGDQAALVLRFWPEDTGDLHTVNATIPELSKFADAHADSAGVWRSLGRAMLIVGRDEEALEKLGKAVELDVGDDDLRAEWWSELGKQRRFERIVSDAEKIGNMNERDWKLRWNEAEAYAGLGKRLEARTLFTNINADGKLHVDVRKRAKRAVQSILEGDAAVAPKEEEPEEAPKPEDA